MPTLSITELKHAGAGPCTRVAVTHLSTDRVVTALCANDGHLQVIVWDVAGDGTITLKGNATSVAASRVAVTDWPGQRGIVTAARNADGNLEVTSWAVASAGTVTKAGTAKAGAVSDVAISSPSGFAGVVTPVINGDGNLELITWAIDTHGAITRKHSATAGTASALAAASIGAIGALARLAVAVRNGDLNLEIITWGIASDGALSRLGRADAGPITEVSLVARSTNNADLFSLTTGTTGDLTAIGWTVADDGSMTRFTTARGGHATSVAIATFKPDIHAYAVGAMRTDTGMLKLIAWRNGLDLTRHGEVTSTAIATVAVTTWSQGVVTVATDGSGSLRLTSWHLQPAGVRLLQQEWPLLAAAAPMAAPPKPQTPGASAGAPHGVRAPKYMPSGSVPRRPGGPPPPPGPPPDGSGGDSSGFSHAYFPSVSGVDPMLAVGHDFVVVTQDHQIAFFDKAGAPLVATGMLPMNLSSTSFFQGFINATNPDGSVNANNINTISPTVISEFYDTRVTYDPVTRHFVILSAARQPSTSETRYFAFAVSKTQDPRDGFHQYMTTENNYRDFPRLVVHNGMILQGQNAASPAADGETPVLYAFDLASAAQGIATVPNWEYYPSDLNGAVRVFLVQHVGDTSGLTTLVDLRGGDGAMHISAFSTPSNMWLAPQPLFADAGLTSEAAFPGPFMVFRDATLFTCGPVRVLARIPDVQSQQDSIRAIKVPFSQFTTAGITVDAAHIVDVTFGGMAPGDPPDDLISYDVPHYAMNAQGDALIAYGRTGITPGSTLYPEVRYSVWKHGEAGPRSSALLQAGGYMPMAVQKNETVPTTQSQAYKLDYATAVVDPADDTTVWFIHEYADGPTGYWKTVIGVVNPSL